MHWLRREVSLNLDSWKPLSTCLVGEEKRIKRQISSYGFGTECRDQPQPAGEQKAQESGIHVTYVFWPRLAEYVGTTVKKSAHLLVVSGVLVLLGQPTFGT